MTKELRLLNGRCYGVMPPKMWRTPDGEPYCYIAAHSLADACRVVGELGLGPLTRSEVDKYWNKDAWGNLMDDVTPKRGMWVSFGRNKPVEVTPTMVLEWGK